MKRISRRQVLKSAGAAAATSLLGPMAWGNTRWQGANDRVTIGLIGCAAMGSQNMQNLMRFDDIEVIALCDVDESRIPGDFGRVKDKYGRDPLVVKDYRKMLERNDLDAVIVGTPDHWHALNLIDACDAGKDCFCEKPISHNIVEAVAMVDAQRRNKRVVQVGTWQRSGKEFLNAIDYVRSGKLGKVAVARAWISDTFQAGKGTPGDPPASVDWDFWVGPAKMEPFQGNRFHFNWRWFMNYGGGLTTDWGVHMLDIALLGISEGQDLRMPVSVSSVGGRWAYPDDDRTAPDTTEALYRFEDPDLALQWSVGRGFPGKPGHGTEWVGTNGVTVRAWRGGWQVLGGDGKELEKPEPLEGRDHWREFVDCVKSRAKPSADLGSVAQTTIVCHLANVGLDAKELVRWNNARMDLEGRAGRDSEAYEREYRAPWKLRKR